MPSVVCTPTDGSTSQSTIRRLFIGCLLLVCAVQVVFMSASTTGSAEWQGIHADDATWLLQSKLVNTRSGPQRTPDGPLVPALEELPPCVPTPGGGCWGGRVTVETVARVAPPNHFLDGGRCHWQSAKRIALIHVGKTAGASLAIMMGEAPLNFTHVHARWAEQYFDPRHYDLFVVTTRGPVDRTVSAFNWRHNVGGGAEVTLLSPGEKELYRCFADFPGGANSFAEALGEESDCGLTARRALHRVEFGAYHLPMDLNWYVATGLGASLRQSPLSLLAALRDPTAGRRVLLVPTENFTAAADAMWDWLCVPRDLRPAEVYLHQEYPRANDTHLSSRGLYNVRRHTVLERLALEELERLADKW